MVRVSITVPSAFADGLIGAEGDRSRAWLAALPALAGRYLARWRLTVDGRPMHGLVGLVLPVRTAEGAAAVLKLAWPHAESEHEGLALRRWQGRGVVRVLATDDADSVLLLDKLDHTRSLAGAPLAEAVAVCARLLRTLAVPAPPEVRTLTAVAARWLRELPSQPAPARVLDAALAACERYGPATATTLTNQDLHYENVLCGWRRLGDDRPEAAHR